jgi:sensor domain CHASE-containing protein
MTCFILLLYGLSTTILMDGFKKIERKEVEEDLGRMQSAFMVELNQVKSTTRDYSGWDETFNFVQGNDPNYIETNLVDETFISLRLNMMVFLNNSKEIVFEKEVDLKQGNETAFPQSFRDLLMPDCPLLLHTSIDSSLSGIVVIPEGPIFVSSYPILHSDRTGPIGGTLIFGRNLDAPEVDYLANVTQMDLSIFSANDPQLSSALKQANMKLTNESQTFIMPLNEKKIAGYFKLTDLHGNKSVLVRVTFIRDIYNQGLETLNNFLEIVLILLIFICVLSMVFMEWVVLARLRHLSSSINNLGSNKLSSEFTDIDGKDEFAIFSKALRGKLESLAIIPVREIPSMIGKPGPSGILLETPDLQPGRTYFVDEPKADMVFKVFNAMLGRGYEGLCLTRMAPKKVREAANLEKTPIVWLSTTPTPEEKTLDPASIARIHATTLEFLNTAKKPIILLEGLEYLIFVNNFRFVLTMLHSLYERTASSNGMLLLVLSKPAFAPADWALLTKDMEGIDPTLS